MTRAEALAVLRRRLQLAELACSGRPLTDPGTIEEHLANGLTYAEARAYIADFDPQREIAAAARTVEWSDALRIAVHYLEMLDRTANIARQSRAAHRTN